MEDEGRNPLPPGWLRQYDHESHHQFFVDTNVSPPRSIWHHPYDDSQYMNSLDPAERQRIHDLQKVPSQADIEAESSDDDTNDHHGKPNAQSQTPQAGSSAELPPRDSQPVGGVTKFGRRMKDKVTHTTHQEREVKRQRRAEEEQRMYQRHMELRQAMSRAMQTGQPQFIGKGKDGRDLFIEPPQGMGYGQGGYGGRGAMGMGFNPYQQGVYSTPNAMYIRPQYPYSRPYGGGYGGGFGLPLAGGLMGGLLLGSMF